MSCDVKHLVLLNEQSGSEELLFERILKLVPALAYLYVTGKCPKVLEAAHSLRSSQQIFVVVVVVGPGGFSESDITHSYWGPDSS